MNYNKLKEIFIKFNFQYIYVNIFNYKKYNTIIHLYIYFVL